MVRPPHDSSAFLLRIGYDPSIEEQALDELARGMPTAARELFLRLSESLQPGEGTREGRVATQLLLGLLHQIHSSRPRTHPGSRPFQKRRLDLIQRFDGCRNFATARQRFDEAMAELLEPIPETGAANGHHEIVKRVERYIAAHYRQRISLSDIATGLHLSPNYLSRAFKKHAGHTVTTAIQRRRLANARRLLAEGQRSISEIAYRVGYQNYRDFYRNFVKYERASPRQVQRELSRRVS